MSASLAVFAADSVRVGWASDAVLASLPLSYRPSSAVVAGGVVVVAGTPGWPAEVVAAVEAEAAGVIVVHPEPADLTVLPSDISRRAVVVVDARWASNPAVPSVQTALAGARSTTSRLECRLVVGRERDLDAVLLEQLSLIRAVAGGATDLRILTGSAHGYLATAQAADLTVDLGVVVTDALPESATLRLVTADGSVEAQIPDPGTARPALVDLTGPHGTVRQPTLYESGHRISWKRLQRLLAKRETSDDLDHLRADLRTAAAKPLQS